ncbi:MAG: type II toxin-antitoxin system prevent-host-death family antitoxin [Dehalococcoidia bacterium]|jgi:antitoxin (DNA-binding transcriptional repressor) of toxin-antitoxin stability system
MKTVGVYEAKTHLARLLDEVELGECITITRHGKPVAVLKAPDGELEAERKAAIDALLEFGRQHRGALKGLNVKELIEEGRRY